MADSAQGRHPIHVVAGLLVDGERLCLARRHLHKHQGGKWEFPGGKLEPNEAPYAGLVRELHEELGIDVDDALPFMQVRHSYPDFDVLLDIWRVSRYRGTPHGRESQDVDWFAIDTLKPSEFPEADRPILRRLQLPPLYLISDVRRFGEVEFAARLERALAAGARLFQLREPDLAPARFCGYARELAELCHRHGARLLINAEPAWVEECNADGVHLNSARLLQLSTRPLGPDHWVAASCHDALQLSRARELQADFTVLGPVQETPSHPDRVALGWPSFGALCKRTPLPVYALGGMREGDLAGAIAAGAQGLSMISGVWGRDDLEAVIGPIVA
jgi:8-oxo-dGTP diphosphatase